jgi:sugar phosphate isomerase/epimerase
VQLSCLPVSFFKDIQTGRLSIGEWAEMAKCEGLDAIDLSAILVANHTPACLRRVKSDLERAGMPVVMITTYPDFTHPLRAQREREMEYVRRDTALAADLGAKYLRILAGQAHPETAVDQGIEWVVENFKRLDEVAGRLGVTLLFENHSKPGAWDLWDFSHPTEVFLEILEKTTDTGIRINFDTANALVYGDQTYDILEASLPRLETVHIADTGALGKQVPVVIGDGIVRFDEVFARLKRAGFNGWFCIEEASGTGRSGLQKAVHFSRSTWAEA